MKHKTAELEDYTIYDHLLPALVNGDLSGYEDEDLELIKVIEEYIDGRILSMSEEDEQSYFGKPDHGGLVGSVVDVVLVRIQEGGADA